MDRDGHHRDHRASALTRALNRREALRQWARRVSNLRPLACEATRERAEEAQETALTSQCGSRLSCLDPCRYRRFSVDLAHQNGPMGQSRAAFHRAIGHCFGPMLHVESKHRIITASACSSSAKAAVTGAVMPGSCSCAQISSPWLSPVHRRLVLLGERSPERTHRRYGIASTGTGVALSF